MPYAANQTHVGPDGTWTPCIDYTYEINELEEKKEVQYREKCFRLYLFVEVMGAFGWPISHFPLALVADLPLLDDFGLCTFWTDCVVSERCRAVKFWWISCIQIQWRAEPTRKSKPYAELWVCDAVIYIDWNKFRCYDEAKKNDGNDA